MGIRINKKLGWILENQDLNLEPLSKITLQQLKDQHKSDPDVFIDLGFIDVDMTQPLSNFVSKISDDGSSKKLYIFIPPIVKDQWQRYDDAMDYLENKLSAVKVNYINRDLYPFYRKFVVAHNLKELSSIQTQKCQQFSDLDYKCFTPDFQKELTDLGLTLDKPLKDQIYMVCPDILRVFLEKCGENNYKKLRPAIVTYWS